MDRGDNFIPDYIAAAHGDPDACLRLSLFARSRVLRDESDQLTGSMEGATLARLAAIRGDIRAAVLMSEHLLAVAELYNVAGDHDVVEDFCAEAVAIMDLGEGHVPDGWTRDAWSDHVLGVVSRISDNTSAPFMEQVKGYRAIWAQFLSPESVAGAARP